MKKAFTMIELVFVIIILGVLASLAVPKLITGKDDALIAKSIEQISAIRTGIKNYNDSNKLNEKDSYPSSLEDGDTQLFSKVLSGAALKEWSKTTNDTYTINLSGKNATFKYNSSNGKFTCESGCKELFGGKFE
ncbi:type II secretion system protein [Campylobacter hyointestinalis]|uniref:Prepilin-type cleavage/methylation domain-containing protein n=1 Tax=Campylobacter hyointestinalis subsp. hyointestinalis TaxID=91352 RepID=A0A855N8Z9_CAMHY|nr:type II secretion system protein [Campylobacter hyointestinalis]PPB60008.1 prepilin-type cleavage/methylation domain-containing protein [Campylobacter hyointestinalis subsp. hyointestinalis]PPB63652.1 prepilin-type cleavage/methylation domain-containing protein [Campylobacter hyointestinalis subsp. hyointestinalis]PPB72932.1 prepilin-type cleavage/methylation domain-containing protein [Campylobacter hyointestinalis subsp. hyointestinalis]PPB73356.1 prepilin-type cleavage/methylation domain-c